MNFNAIRQAVQPLFGIERRETTARFLAAMLFSGIIVALTMIIVRFLSGETFRDPAVRLLGILLGVQIILQVGVKKGYVYPSAFIFVMITWIVITYQIGAAHGVRDVAVYGYILVILMAALLVNWQACLALLLLSVAAIWTFAISEARGWRVATMDSPIDLATDLTAIFALIVFLVYLMVSALRDSLDAAKVGEAKFSRVFYGSPVAIAIASLEEGLLLDANPAYWKLTGFDPSFALGKTVVELGSWNSRAEREKFVEELKARGSFQNPAYRIRDRSGDDHTALAFHELMEFEGQTVVLSMFYDVTDQKRAQVALEESEQRYRNFVERSMEGIWFLAFDHPIPTSLPAEEQVNLIYRYGYFSDSNDVLAQMYGYMSSAEMRGVRLLDFQPGGELNEVNYQATLQLVKDGYRSGNRETKEQTRDGKTVYFLNNAIGVVKDSCLVGVWGTQLDITILKNTEEALRDSQARTRALLSAIPDMIFEFKHDGTMLEYISSARNRPLLPPAQFLGKKIADVLPSSVANQTMFSIERVLESGHVHAFDYQLLQDNQTKTFEARLTPLSTDTVLAIVRDVSLQKWILGEREKLITELELKNAELERFTYTVSHDLKSPLITIKGFLGFLREDAQKGNLKRLESDIQRIGNAADKMQQLLSDLLELSRIGRLVHASEPIDLPAMIKDVIELLHGHLSDRHIQVTVREPLPRVYGDRARLMEVWQNLIDNAAKFMGDQPNPQIEIGQAGSAENDSPIFFVRDNGMGIDPRFTDRIFGLFDKLDPRTEGTGIGLALVKRIVEFHGGRVWVESEPGKGSTFYLTLPNRETVQL